MAEFIKKFANPAAADQYAIKDIPFITSVDGDPIQNLHCSESGKKLVNTSGTVTIISATKLIPSVSFKLISVEYSDDGIWINGNKISVGQTVQYTDGDSIHIQSQTGDKTVFQVITNSDGEISIENAPEEISYYKITPQAVRKVSGETDKFESYATNLYDLETKGYIHIAETNTYQALDILVTDFIAE